MVFYCSGLVKAQGVSAGRKKHHKPKYGNLLPHGNLRHSEWKSTQQWCGSDSLCIKACVQESPVADKFTIL